MTLSVKFLHSPLPAALRLAARFTSRVMSSRQFVRAARACTFEEVPRLRFSRPRGWGRASHVLANSPTLPPGARPAALIAPDESISGQFAARCSHCEATPFSTSRSHYERGPPAQARGQNSNEPETLLDWTEGRWGRAHTHVHLDSVPSVLSMERNTARCIVPRPQGIHHTKTDA